MLAAQGGHSWLGVCPLRKVQCDHAEAVGFHAALGPRHRDDGDHLLLLLTDQEQPTELWIA